MSKASKELLSDCVIRKMYSLQKIKLKFLLLYILNITDIIFTFLLIRTGYFIEANKLMDKIMQSPSASILLKIVLPAVLFIVVFIRMQRATDRQLRISNYLINIATSIYALINLSHIVWLVMLP